MIGIRLQQANSRALNFLKRTKQYDKYVNLDNRHIGIARKTRVRCSCWMCGHQRQYQGKPISEIKKDIELTEE